MGEIPVASWLGSSENFEGSISTDIAEYVKVMECVITFHGENENYKKLYDYKENFKKHADALKERVRGMSQKEKAWEIMESLLTLRKEEKEHAKKLYEADKDIAPEKLANPPFYYKTTGIFRCYAQLAAVLGFEKAGIFRGNNGGTTDRALIDCGAWVEIDGIIYAPGEKDIFGTNDVTKVKWVPTVSKYIEERTYQILKREFEWEDYCVKNQENRLSFSKWCEENSYSDSSSTPWEPDLYSLSSIYDYIREYYEEYQRIQAQDRQERLNITSEELRVLRNMELFNTKEKPYYQGDAMEVNKVEYCLLTKEHWIEFGWLKSNQDKMKMIDINTDSMLKPLSEQYVVS